MKKQVLIIAFFLQFVTGCTSDDNKHSRCENRLPPETTTGANTFGCCVNGNLLIPRDGSGTWGGADRGFLINGDPSGNNRYAELDVVDFKSDRTASILVHIHDIVDIGVGEYVINESNGLDGIDGLNHTYIHCRVFNESTNNYRYYRSFENSGVLTITRFDFENKIISGIFNCLVKSSVDENDIIEIKEGRFDVNFNTLSNVSFP